jgi:hypothetical protein
MAGGQFVKIIEKRLRVHGHSDENIKRRVFGFESSDMRVNYAVNKHGLVGTYSSTDFLSWETDMKFDVIVGNPPFNGNNKQIKPWVQFYEKSFNLLKDGGYHLFVTPIVWTKRPTSPLFLPVSELFSKFDLKYCNLNVDVYFNNIGESIGYQLLLKSNNDIKTVFEYNGIKFKLKYSGQLIPFNDDEKLLYSIFDKIENSNHQRLSSIFSKRDASGSGTSLRTGRFSEINTNENSIPLLYTINSIYYIKNSNKYTTGLKLFLNHSGYYFTPSEPDKYMPILEGFVAGQNLYSIDIPSKSEGIILRHIFSRKLFRFYIENEKSSGFNTGIPKLPWIGYEKKYSDIEIYKMFNLSSEEIDYIEANVK